jgi:hypothetical protein
MPASSGVWLSFCQLQRLQAATTFSQRSVRRATSAARDPGSARSGVLFSAVEAAMIVATEQGAIAQRRCEALHDAPFEGDDRLQVDARALAGQRWMPPNTGGSVSPMP